MLGVLTTKCIAVDDPVAVLIVIWPVIAIKVNLQRARVVPSIHALSHPPRHGRAESASGVGAHFGCDSFLLHTEAPSAPSMALRTEFEWGQRL